MGRNVNVYLDDYRPCPKGFVLARNAEECVALLREGGIRILSLDYDLGWGQPNGADVVYRMANERLHAQDVYLHTSSPAGRKQMFEMLAAYKPEGMTIHNGPMPEHVLRSEAGGHNPL